MGHRRPTVADERGLTLVEVMISALLTLVVLSMAYGILSASLRTASTVGSRAQNSTEARIVIDELEADLRFADGVWVCGAPANGNLCPAPTSNPPVTMTVSNAAASNNASQPACAQWTLTSAPSGSATTAGLVETSGGTSSVAMAGTVAYTGTTGFSRPLPRLVEIDLSVNQETGPVVAGDAVSVHEVIAPQNLATAQASTVSSSTPCTP